MWLWSRICPLCSVLGQSQVPQQDQALERMLTAGAEQPLENLSPKPSSSSLLQAEGAG